MLIINLEQLNHIGYHIITAVNLEIVFVGQGTLVLPLRKGGFHIMYVPNVSYAHLDLASV
jgi:hypothetical protein